ncbi:MAG: ribonuclease PH [Lentisphaeria bacterium]|nr:ribonuclease PH [Lentisphaeria bacterium]
MHRAHDQLRNIEILTNVQKHPLGSAIFAAGNTRVLCSASVKNESPRWKKEQGVTGGWLTAEYGMLPGSTSTRKSRSTKGLDGRSTEIQRLIGRSLRAVVDLEKIDGVTINLDCDVLDADGGTRCASINGAAIALQLSVNKLLEQGLIEESPIKEMIGAVSVGILDGKPVLDLDYDWDSRAEVDMNVVMTESGKFVEIQGTGEEAVFSAEQLSAMLDLAGSGIKEIIQRQKEILKEG